MHPGIRPADRRPERPCTLQAAGDPPVQAAQQGR
jgi:hypothetical protein